MAPKNPLYRNNIATVLVDQCRFREAFTNLREVHSEAAAYYNLGCLLNKKGNTPAAMQNFALALGPTRRWFPCNAGIRVPKERRRPRPALRIIRWRKDCESRPTQANSIRRRNRLPLTLRKTTRNKLRSLWRQCRSRCVVDAARRRAASPLAAGSVASGRNGRAVAAGHGLRPGRVVRVSVAPPRRRARTRPSAACRKSSRQTATILWPIHALSIDFMSSCGRCAGHWQRARL